MRSTCWCIVIFGKSVRHGGPGWSTVVPLHGHSWIKLLDAGPFAQRQPVFDRLQARGLRPGDVTDLLLNQA